MLRHIHPGHRPACQHVEIHNQVSETYLLTICVLSNSYSEWYGIDLTALLAGRV